MNKKRAPFSCMGEAATLISRGERGEKKGRETRKDFGLFFPESG